MMNQKRTRLWYEYAPSWEGQLPQCKEIQAKDTQEDVHLSELVVYCNRLSWSTSRHYRMNHIRQQYNEKLSQ
jgi:hypothetical protein